MRNCERCGKPTNGITIMSYFNTQTICMDCEGKERKHPRCEEARKADEDACRRKDFNFPGIGYPG